MASNGTIRGDSTPLKTAQSYAEAIDSGRMDDTRVRDGIGKEKLISIAKMFTFADRKDAVLMVVGTLAAVLHGTGQIIHILLLTRVLNRFIDLTQLFCAANESVCEGPSNTSTNLTNREDLDEIGDELLQELTELALFYLPLAFGVLVMAAIATSTWNLAGYRQGLRIRRALFSSIVHQDLSWHDISTTAELTNRLSDDVEKIQEGLGDRVAIFIQFTSTFLSGFVVAFVFNWRLALVVVSVLPVMVVLVAVLTRIVTQFTSREQSAYAKAGAIAEEVFSSIRTVVAFGGQEKEAQRYGKELRGALRVGIMRGAATGFLFGAVLAVFFSSYALAFWYGAILSTDCPVEDQLQPGDLFTVFICIIIGGFSVGQAAPELERFFVGRGSATVVYRIIARVPTIDGRSPLGTRPKKLDPVVELRNVHFTYPSRPDIPVLKGLSIAVRPGQTLALVGPSGCGKSTVVQLVQRFYDALGGQVLIGGYDIRELNIRWLRQHIGVVSQEPVLFATTIAENIRYGKEDATQDEIERAAKAANAHTFISELPDGYDTLVGDRGAQLSGGQKQRVAIARALVRDPKILLLDEATSALDTESEAQVQIALDRARQGRTTIVIAHRLSTVQTADMIAAIQNGRVAELGTHAKLMSHKGVYYDLVTAQMIEVEEESNKEPLTEFRMALKHSQHKMSYNRQASNFSQSSHFTPEPVESPSFLKRQFSSAFSLDQPPDEDIQVKEDWNPTCLDLMLGRIEQPQEKPKDKRPSPPSLRFWQLLALNKPEWYLVVIGVFFSAIVGATQPTLSIVFSRMLEILGGCNEDVILEQTRETVPFFVMIGIIVLVATAIQNITLSIASERLTLRLRWDTFKAFLRQDMSWFDEPDNSTGVLTTCLAVETSHVKGATGVSFGLVLQAVSALTVALIIAFYSSWHLTLVVMGCVPFVVLTGAYQSRHIRGRAAINKKLLEGAGRLASQAIENVRTLHSLGIETSIDIQYSEGLKEPFKIGVYGSLVHGLVYGFSQCVPFILYCITFSFSRFLVQEGLAEYQDIFRTLVAIVLTSMTVGRLTTYAPETGKARLAAARIFEIINRKPAIDSHSDIGIKPDSNDAMIDFNSIHFNYPTRPEVPVLQGMDLAVKSGQTVALVGPSGCGKSTVVQLLLRFYDPLEGRVELDGTDVKVLSLQWLRSQIGLVSQEPVLFDTTIADNIRYGANFREVTDNEVEAAAKAANIHNFIMGLPEGYQTNVGSRGTQLSGGQKQRVAIARALIRDPKILLLDEATSALDTESEKIVQEALDDARQGRTSIVIAHRLSTIQNADCIAVIHNGQVIESGTHKQLMSLRGAYYLLSTTSTVQ